MVAHVGADKTGRVAACRAVLYLKASGCADPALQDSLDDHRTMILDVRQRQFAFGQRGCRVEELVTGDVASCSAIVAIDRKSGLIFMAHLDVWWLGSMAGGFEELRDRASDLANVDLYDVAGFTPRMLGLVALVTAVLPLAAANSWIGLPWAAAWIWMLGGTRLRARWHLWRLGFRGPRLLTPRDARGERHRWFPCRVNVRVCADAPSGAGPDLYLPKLAERDPRFLVEPPAGNAIGSLVWWHPLALVKRGLRGFRLTRAQGSE